MPNERPILFYYFLCVRPGASGPDRWPPAACSVSCKCQHVTVCQGILADEHRIDWSLPENQP